MPKSFNLQTRHHKRESPPLRQSNTRVHRAVLPAIPNRRDTNVGKYSTRVHLRFGRCTLEGPLSFARKQPQQNHHTPRRSP